MITDTLIKQLEWDDTREIRLDSTMIFSLGYDFYGFDYLRLEASGRLGRYAIWPESSIPSTYSLYRDTDGAFSYGKYKSYKEAQSAAEDWDRE